jgi:hypothetical protein
VLDLAPALNAKSHPATCRVLPYAIWHMRSPDWHPDAIDLLETLAASSDDATAQAARLVLSELSKDPAQYGWQLGDDVQAMLQADAESAAQSLIQRFTAYAVSAKSSEMTQEPLLALYALSRHDADLRRVLCLVLKQLALGPGVMRPLRRIFKACEAFDDAPVFATLAWRFAITPHGYSGWGTYNYRTGTVYYADEIRKPNPSIAFGRTTKDYLNRRIVRHLRSTGGFGRAEYVTLAAMCLMDERNCQIDQDGNHSFPARDFILGDTNATARSEPFPDLWDEAPGILLEVLLNTAHAATAEFATRALQDNSEYCRRIRPGAIGRLFQKAPKATRAFALRLVEDRAASGQLSVDLLCILAAQDLEGAQRLAQSALQMAPERWLSDPDDAARLLLGFTPTATDWLADFLATAPLNEAAVLDRLLARVQDLDAKSDRPFDKSKAKSLAQAIAARFGTAISALPGDRLTKLSNHNLQPNQLFALRLAACRPDGAALFDAQALAQSADPEIQASAAALFAGADKATLLASSDLVVTLLLHGEEESSALAKTASLRLLGLGTDGQNAVLPPLLNAVYQDEPREGVHDELADLFGLTIESGAQESGQMLRQGVLAMGPTVIWSLIRARTKIARGLGATVVQDMPADSFSLRKIARIGVCDQKLARDWAIAALRTRSAEVDRSPQDIFAVLDGDWEDSRKAAYDLIRAQGSDNWPDEAVLALCDCVSKPAQGFGRELLALRMSPDNAPGFLTRLAEHPGQSFRLTIARLIREHAGDDPKRLRQLEPALRHLLQRVHASRAAKEQIWRFLEDRIAQGTAEDHSLIAPILSDMAASIVRVDRDRAISLLVLLRQRNPAAKAPSLSEART